MNELELMLEERWDMEDRVSRYSVRVYNYGFFLKYIKIIFFLYFKSYF